MTENRETSSIPLRTLAAMAWMQRTVVFTTIAACVGLAILVTMVTPKLYEATATLEVQANTGQEMKVQRLMDFQPMNNMYLLQQFYRTETQKITSRSTREEVIRRYVAAGHDDLTLEDKGPAKLHSMLEVSPRPNSSLVDITVTHRDPTKAAVLANLVAEVYLYRTIKSRQDAASGAREWLQTQVNKYNDQIADGAETLLTFQGANDLADVEESVSTLSATIRSLNEAYASVSTERLLKQSALDQHAALLRQQRYDELGALMDGNLLRGLTESYATANTNHLEVSARLGEKHPQFLESKARLNQTEAALQAEVEQQLENERVLVGVLTNKVKDLETQIEEAKMNLLAKQTVLVDYDAMRTRQDHSRDFLEKLKQRQDELDLAAQTQVSNATVMDDARAPESPVSPKPVINLAASLAFGLVAGLALALGREFTDDTIKSGAEVPLLLGVPYLGHIPKLEDPGELPALHSYHNPGSTLAESVRLLRTVLLGSHSLTRRLLVTSAAVAEGKSDTSVRMGISFSQLGRSVVVVDCDLRRSRLHHALGIQNEVGVTTVLNEGASLDDVLQETVIENLTALTAGGRVTNPNELLASAEFLSLLDELNDRFDLVVIDSPPILPVADALVLAKHVDGVMVIVRSQAHSRSLTRACLDRLKEMNAPIFGIVLNAVDPTGFNAYYYASNYKYYAGYDPDPVPES